MPHRTPNLIVGLAAAIAALALSASDAAASSPGRNLALATPIAEAAWPASPCAGRESVQITSALMGDRDAEAEVDGSCVVRIRPIHDPYKFCVTLVHEFGHLTESVDDNGHLHLPDGRPVDEAGHTHDGSIMDVGGGFWDPCEALGPMVTPRAAAADIFDLPASRCRLTMVARRPRGRLYTCGVRRQVFVAMTGSGDIDRVIDRPRHLVPRAR